MKKYLYTSILKLSSYIVLSILILLFFSSCDEESLPGCMDSTACNFNASATDDDQSCTYAQQNRDCDDNCLVDVDCAGNCAGIAVLDCNNECDGIATLDCNDECDGLATEDCTGECGGSATLDCTGECEGDAIYDECNICNGTGLNEQGCCGTIEPDCEGECEGDAYIDCNDDCCQPTVFIKCESMLISEQGECETGDSTYECFTQLDFCTEYFSDNTSLEEQCNSFIEEDMVDGDLEAFCQEQFECASLDCSGLCAGGNTNTINYNICGCFEPNAANYWCNDGGQCPFGSSSVPSLDALDCQPECITGITGSYTAINPYTYDNGVLVYNDVASCCTDGCTDVNAANYDGCSEDFGTCEYTNYFKIGTITDSTIEILISSSFDIYGFQFDITGLTIDGIASGGISEAAEFSTSYGSNGVLGLSFTGAFIPSTNQEEVFVVLNYSALSQNLLCLPIENSDSEAVLIISGEAGANLSDQFIVHYESSCP